MPIRKKGKSYQIDYYDESGKRIRKNLKTKMTAEGALAEALKTKDRIKAGLEVPDKTVSISVEDFYKWIVANITTRKSKLTAEGYIRHLDNFYKWLFSCKPEIEFISDITIRDIDEYISFRLKSVKSNTVNHELDSMRTLCNIAIDLELLKGNPFKNIKSIRPAKTKEAPFFYKKEEIKGIFGRVSPRFKPFYITLLYTGVRAGELVLFEWEDFDFRNSMVYVRTKGGRTEVKMRTRSIPMHSQVAWAIRERRKLKENERLVFTTLGGELFKPRMLRKIWQKAVKAAGYGDLQHTHIHALRHTFASWLAMSGKVTLKQISEWLGHTSVKHTEIYAHLIPEPKSKILDDALGDFEV